MSDDIKIVGLLCNWCCYGGADTAGTAGTAAPQDADRQQAQRQLPPQAPD